jgi:hypothetical protein
MPRNDGQYRRNIQEVAGRMKGVHLAYTETSEFHERGWLKDNVHYNQEALNHIGHVAANVIFGLTSGR